MSSVETVSALERRLNASIPQQAIRNEVIARLKKIGRTAKISGFRPGKIPPKILEQHYGAQAQQEALSDLLQRSFDDAAQLNNLLVAGHPRFEITSNDPNAENIEYSASFEVYPEVVMAEIAEGSLERMVCELTPGDVDHAIMQLRKQRATFEPVERAVQNEDQVYVDFAGKIDGESFQGGDARDHRFTMGAGSVLPEFEAAIIGMKPGETRSFDITFPEDYHGEEVAGKHATFTVTLHKAEVPILPEVDSNFAESIGIEGGDVSKLEDEIQANLRREMVRRLKARNKEAAMDALLKAALFEVPGVLVGKEARNLMNQAVEEMKSRGIKDAELSPEPFIDRAIARVKLGFIIAELAQKHNLNARHEQVRTLIDDYAQSFEEPEEVVKWFYTNSSQLQEIQNLVLEENIVNWTMEQAKAADRSIPFNELMGI